MAVSGGQDRNSDAHVFCASTKDTANSNLVYDRNQPTPVVDSVGDPLMPFGHVADVDAAIPKRHGMLFGVTREAKITNNNLRSLSLNTSGE